MWVLNVIYLEPEPIEPEGMQAAEARGSGNSTETSGRILTGLV